MPGFDLSSKLRRAFGQGQVLPPDVLAEKMKPFDRDLDGALVREELADFLRHHGVGGSWFCGSVAKNMWTFCTNWYARDISWIRIDMLSWIIHNSMTPRERPTKRYRITPEGAMGYVPLEPLAAQPESPAARRSAAPNPASRPPLPRPPTAPTTQASSAGPRLVRPPMPSAANSGPRAIPRPRPAARPVPRRPGPRK